MTENNSQYKSLAIKYRPGKLSEVIGQEVVVKIISNSLASSRLSSAILLVGTRGIGKTTIARIIAKALNCQNPINSDLYDSCGECNHCKEISDDNHLDVIEIDAASRNKVADVREIIDQLQYMPSTSKYKIYIIDETHMLSIAAFNALLKTLEEPPKHVKFILATTEIKKIPLPVISRCQRLNFFPIECQVMKPYLQEIAQEEGYQLENVAADRLSELADGALRDGLLLLEQAMLYSNSQNKTITEDIVAELFSIVPQKNIYQILFYIFDNDLKSAINITHELYKILPDATDILVALISVVHELLLYKTCNSIIKNQHYITQYKKIIDDSLTETGLIYMGQVLYNSYQTAKLVPNTKIAVDMVLFKLMHVNQLPPLKKIYDKLSDELNISSKSNQATHQQTESMQSEHPMNSEHPMQTESMQIEQPMNSEHPMQTESINFEEPTKKEHNNKDLEAISSLFPKSSVNLVDIE